MAKTREALTEKLQTLKERVLGPGEAAPNQGVQAMAKKRTASRAAKKGGAAKKARGGAKAKSGGARKMAASASRRSAGPKAATKAQACQERPAKKAKTAKKSTSSKVVSKLKETGTDMLAGALSGALKGAAGAVRSSARDDRSDAAPGLPAATPCTAGVAELLRHGLAAAGAGAEW